MTTHHPRSWRAGCEETRTSGSGRGPSEKDPLLSGHLADGLPEQALGAAIFAGRLNGRSGVREAAAAARAASPGP
jgi:hypothetical protein